MRDRRYRKICEELGQSEEKVYHLASSELMSSKSNYQVNYADNSMCIKTALIFSGFNILCLVKRWQIILIAVASDWLLVSQDSDHLHSSLIKGGKIRGK